MAAAEFIINTALTLQITSLQNIYSHTSLVIHLQDLADEYYTSDVAYNDFFKPTVEPVEPNITALMDPKNIKWKKYLSDGIEIPTPWEKEEFDRFSYEWLKERNRLNSFVSELKRNRAPESEIKAAEEEYAMKDKKQSEIVDKYLMSSKYWNKVGAFEGGWISAKRNLQTDD
ncbi:MAG: M64 family metallopeptidase [Ignavibacteriales bacterium]|nr:M64 family metallopeptidase [Ignavibacteriales bacterium]